MFPNETCPDSGVALPSGLTVDVGDASYGVTENSPGALAGTAVEFQGAWDPGDVWHEWDRFFTETGIYVSYVGTAPGVEATRREFEGLTPPDIFSNPAPGGVVYTGEQGYILDLSPLHDTVGLQDAFGPYLLELVTVAPDGTWPAPSGSVYGIPIEIDLKGLVFYPRSAFESAGYQVPETWDELIGLSSQMVADGRTPWCIGFESGGLSDGWPGTDWVESLVVREAGPPVYDDWAAHRVPFDNEAVRSAGERFDQLVSTPGFVWLGKERISQLHFMFDLVPELEKAEPSCWMYHQGDFALSVFSAGTEFGRDIDFFVLPPIDPSSPTPVLGGGNYATARADRPEVRAMLEHLASPRWGEMWARQPDSGFISPNAGFDVNQYGADAGESERAVRIALGTAARDAIAAGVWRFDASDLMPPDIGSHAAEGPGAFWQGMLDYVDGVRTMDQVLSDIEAAWIALEAEEGG